MIANKSEVTPLSGAEERRISEKLRAAILLVVTLAVVAVLVLGATHTPKRDGRIEFVSTERFAEATAEREDLGQLWGIRGRPDKEPLYKGPRADIAYGSMVTSTTTFPYVVRITYDGQQWCTGEIVSPNYVLTAAHCMQGNALGSFRFVAGEITTAGGSTTQTRSATAVHVHQNYQSNTFVADIALVRVDVPFTSGPSVNGISLIGVRPGVGTALIAVGWGNTEASTGTNQLKSATMSVVTCGVHQNEANDICTQGGSGNTCGGDSGGPLVKGTGNNQELVGLNSFSKTSCTDLNGNVDVFETTTPFLSWVNGYLPVYQLQLMVIPGKSQYVNSDGVFTRSGSMLFNKMIYKNAAKSMFLAFNNHKWVASHFYYLNAMLANPSAGFGGYFFSNEANAALECALFPDYVITPQKIILTTKPGGSNYANCDGTYTKVNTWLHGQPIYVNSAKSMFLGFGGSDWVITHTYYQANIIATQPTNYGGYHYSTSKVTTAACSTWSSYTVTYE